MFKNNLHYPARTLVAVLKKAGMALTVLGLCAGLFVGVARAAESSQGVGERLPGAAEPLNLEPGQAGDAEAPLAGSAQSGKSAAPAGKPRQEPSPWGMLVPMLIMVPVFWLLVIRPQSQQTKERNKMLAAVGPGDEVQLSGGILGTVQKLKEDHMVVQIAEGVSIRVRKDGVAVLKPREAKGSAKA